MLKEQRIYSEWEKLARVIHACAVQMTSAQWSQMIDWVQDSYDRQRVLDHIKGRKHGAVDYKYNIANTQLMSSIENIKKGSSGEDKRPDFLVERLNQVRFLKQFN